MRVLYIERDEFGCVGLRVKGGPKPRNSPSLWKSRSCSTKKSHLLRPEKFFIGEIAPQIGDVSQRDQHCSSHTHFLNAGCIVLNNADKLPVLISHIDSLQTDTQDIITCCESTMLLKRAVRWQCGHHLGAH